MQMIEECTLGGCAPHMDGSRSHSLLDFRFTLACSRPISCSMRCWSRCKSLLVGSCVRRIKVSPTQIQCLNDTDESCPCNDRSMWRNAASASRFWLRRRSSSTNCCLSVRTSSPSRSASNIRSTIALGSAAGDVATADGLVAVSCVASSSSLESSSLSHLA